MSSDLELAITYWLSEGEQELARGTRVIPLEPDDRVILIDARAVIASRAERLAAERDAIVVRPYVPLQ